MSQKCAGEGLGGGLEGLVVRLEAERAEVLQTAADQLEEMGAWEINVSEPMPGYVAAVAAAGRGWHLKAWRWRASEKGIC